MFGIHDEIEEMEREKEEGSRRDEIRREDQRLKIEVLKQL